MSLSKPTYICLHHSAVSYKRNKDQFKANNRYHKEKWNFKSSLGYYLGYNWEISARGKARQARKNGDQTAACYQSNMNDGRCIHICLDGNFDIERPTNQQIFALRDLLRKLVGEYEIKRDNIVMHTDYAPKTCPGNNVVGDREFIKNLVEWQKPPDEDINEPNKDELKATILKELEQTMLLIKKLINKF